MALKRNFISFYSEFRFCFLFWPALMENIFISWMLQTFVTFQLKIFCFMSNPCKLNRINFISVYSKVKKKTRENLSNFTTVDHSTRMKKGPQWRISVEEKNMKNRKTFWFHHASSQEYERYQKKIQFERIQLSMQCGSETESMMIRKYPFISHSIHFRLLIQFSIATMFIFSSAINGNLSLTYVHEFNLGTTCAKKIQKLTNCGKTPEVLLTYELKF